MNNCKVGKIFENVLKEVSYAQTRLHLFDQKYSKNSNILKYYHNLRPFSLVYLGIF